VSGSGNPTVAGHWFSKISNDEVGQRKSGEERRSRQAGVNRPSRNFLSIVLACQKLNDSRQFSPEEIARVALLHQSVIHDWQRSCSNISKVDVLCVALMVGLFCSGEADNALGTYLVYYLIQLTKNSTFGDSTAVV